MREGAKHYKRREMHVHGRISSFHTAQNCMQWKTEYEAEAEDKS